MRFALLGPPGSGKGTQGEYLSRKYGVPHVSTGEMIRHQISLQTAFGRKVADNIAQGRFAPDADMIQWVEERLSCPDANNGYVLDGFPRDLAQVHALELTAHVAKLNAVIELRLSPRAAQERLRGRWLCPQCDQVYHAQVTPPRRAGQCDQDGVTLVRRADDDGEIVQERMEWYDALTAPVRDYYLSQNILVSVDADSNPEAVHLEIVALLEARHVGYKNAWLEV